MRRTSRSFVCNARAKTSSIARSGNQTELVSGFPKTEEELFAYDALIIGSVEAGFNADQLRNIEGFVARRGGGLLAPADGWRSTAASTREQH
jgi:hypothetical protein